MRRLQIGLLHSLALVAAHTAPRLAAHTASRLAVHAGPLAVHPATRGGVVICKESETAADSEVLPQSYFQQLDYDEAAVPWDLLGRPQPCVRDAALQGAFGEGTAILDCGCGAGDNANWLAAKGFDVLGFDFNPSAVATARSRSAEAATAEAIAAASGAVEFTVASAVDLKAAERIQERARELGGFEVILDSALLHCLDDEAQRAYLDGVRPLLRPGGRLYIGCFSDRNPDPWKNPRRLSEAQLRALFDEANGWSGARRIHRATPAAPQLRAR